MLAHKELLDLLYQKYNQTSFIPNDPISVPHRFSKKADIEIAGLIAAIFAWGLRKTIINKSNEFLKLMDDVPHDFLMHHKEKDLRPFESFVHRTFQGTDALYLLHFLTQLYRNGHTLEDAFCRERIFSKGKILPKNLEDVTQHLNTFHANVFSLPYAPNRTRKHFARPSANSTCKRLCMYLRWMVRKDKTGVDFGIWNQIKPSQLVCPIDLHVERVARELKLMKGNTLNWHAAQELTASLRQLDPRDPAKYDFALFGFGVNR